MEKEKVVQEEVKEEEQEVETQEVEQSNETQLDETVETQEHNIFNLTFDELLEHKAYRSEFDKRVAKALKTSKNSKEVEDLKKQVRDYQCKDILRSKNVQSNFSDYVIFEVQKMDGKFEDNIDKFLQENQHFLKQEIKSTPKMESVTVKGKQLPTEREI